MNISAIVLSVSLKNAVINLAAGTTWSGWEAFIGEHLTGAATGYSIRNLKIYRYKVIVIYDSLIISGFIPEVFKLLSQTKNFHIFCSTVQIADLKVFPFTWKTFSVSVIPKASSNSRMVLHLPLCPDRVPQTWGLYSSRIEIRIVMSWKFPSVK